MKKWHELFVLSAFAAFLFALPAHADDAVAAVTAPPEWLGSILVFFQSLPYVGPVLVAVLKWMGVITTLFTALSIAVQAILTIPELVAKWAGAQKAADQIKKYSDIVLPYLKYLSIFNVQKK
jgi:hypothetical protein